MQEKNDLIKIRREKSIMLIAIKLAVLLTISFMAMGLLGFLESRTFSVETLLSVITFIVAAVVPLVIIANYTLKNQSFKRIEQWAIKHEYEFFYKGKRDEIKKRFSNSPEKYFFGARNALANAWKLTGPYAEGKVKNRPTWLYITRMYSSIMQWKRYDDIYSGWCMEFQTGKVPHQVLVTRKYYSRGDTLDTESRKFEKLYDVKEKRSDNITLQLLDPVMIELITNSDISAIEFSDSSVVLYFPGLAPSNEKLDTIFDFGLKIAEQVDRNFPMGKYEKK